MTFVPVKAAASIGKNIENTADAGQSLTALIL